MVRADNRWVGIIVTTTALLLLVGIDREFGPVALGTVIYLLPLYVALFRRQRHPGPTIVVNVFLGWTVIGWIIALAMAFGGDTIRAEAA